MNHGTLTEDVAETFPANDDWQGWIDVWCADDTGNIDCVAPCLRPSIAKEVTPEGWLKRPLPPFDTPLKLARYFNIGRPNRPPWAGTGLSPQAVKAAWIEAIEEAKPKAPPEPIGTSDLYFIQSAAGPIKIGVSNNVAKRLKGLQTSNPHKLTVLAIVRGGALMEFEYHQRFADHRLEGEWFDPHPDILAEIARLEDSCRRAAA